jgi:GNAT superfamily N-acetyltransferase
MHHKAVAPMSTHEIHAVNTSALKKLFFDFPWQLYRDDPHWIPPLQTNQRELLGFKKHPFHQAADMQTFVATRDGKACGRIAALVNHPHNERFNEKRGFFGFFDCIDDKEVARDLFAASREWLSAQGMTAIRGPVNPSMNYECGLLVEGFDSSPYFMMTYNKPYYGDLLEACGLQKAEDMYAFWGHVDMLEGLDKKMHFVVEEATRRFNIKLRRISRKHFTQDVRTFLDIYNQSLGSTWGFVPLSESEIDHMAHSMKQLIVPEVTTVAEVDGKPIGVAFGLLDYNPRIKSFNGRLFPFGFMKLLWNRQKMKKLRLVATNVIPEYQKWGVGLVLLDRLVPEILEWGIEEAEFSWVLESNHLSRKTLERGGAKRSKTYRLYDGEV